VVALSRFGYPGSAAPPAGLSPAALTEAQAEAAADVLDALGIGRVAVAGISAGAAPALALARREPDRVRAAVLLVPVLRLPDAPPPLDWGPLKRAAAERLLRSDLGLWAALRLARRRTVSALMATDAALLRRLPADERDRLEALIATLLPVRPRGAGYLMDAEAVTTPVPSALLSVAQPVLALAALDDRFGSAAIARALAAALPQGRAVTYASGGHLGVGCAAAMLDETAAFLDNLPP
jgi:pimeloyl-ACP methyl ester carboxylesterase